MIKYHNTSKNGRHFIINEQPGVREYDDVIANDKLFTISASEYPYTTDDIIQMAVLMITNKTLPQARLNEANRIIKKIRQSLNLTLL